MEITDVTLTHSYDLRADQAKSMNYIRALHRPTGIAIQVSGEGYFRTRELALKTLEGEIAKQHGTPVSSS